MPPRLPSRCQFLTLLLTLSVGVLAGCAGGGRGGSSDPAAVGDIDRILADNPDSASAGELARMRNGLAGRGRVMEEAKPFDRRTLVPVRRRDRLFIRDPAWPDPAGGGGRLVGADTAVRLD